jgi:hypothetical protein
MKSKQSFRLLIWCLVVFLTLLACGISVDTGSENTESPATSPPNTPVPAEPSPLPPTNTPLAVEPSPTVQAGEVTEPTSQPTPTPGPQCIVQQSLRLRRGPGILYEPPLYAMETGTVLIPIGYNPTGFPGGSWVQVNDTARNQIGWTSAGEEFVSCNIDLTSLPSVAVDPPPPPAPPRIGNSGSAGDGPDNLVVDEDFDEDFLLQFYAHDVNYGDEDGDGIIAVEFTIQDSDFNVVHSNSEETPGFCVFGGGEPDCNTWLIEDSVYKWRSTGEPVRDGVYVLRVRVIMDDSGEGNWNYELTVDLD